MLHPFKRAFNPLFLYNRLQSDLGCLRDVWSKYEVIQEQHSEWKRGRWQRINTKLMWKATEAQFNVIRSLPDEAYNWDVYIGMRDSILDIQVRSFKEVFLSPET